MRTIRRIFILSFLFIFVVFIASNNVVYAIDTDSNGYTSEHNANYQSFKNLYLFAETIADAKDEIKIYEANIKAMELTNHDKYKSEIAEAKANVKRINDLLDEMKESDKKTYMKSEKYVNKYHSNKKITKEVVKQLKEIKNFIELANAITVSSLDWAKNGANADHLANSLNLASSLTKFAITLFCPATGVAFDAVYDTFCTIVNSNDVSESEIKQLQNVLMDRLDEVDFHIDEVQRDMNALSKSVDASTKEIISELSNAIEASYAKQQINEFLSSKNGNFDYSLFKEYLYASPDVNSEDYSRNALYYKLLSLEEGNASKEKIKQAYDELYKALDVSQAQGQKTPVEKLYEYLMKSDSGIESIQYYYFEFLSANNKDEDIVPTLEAIEFTLDLYTSAMMADVCIEYCNAYQLQHLEEVDGELIYRYGNEKNEYITYDDIIGTSQLIKKREINLEEQILNDITVFLNIGNSYSFEIGDDFVYSNNYDSNFGNVQNGTTLYINKFTISNLLDRFGFEENLFEYKFYNNDKILSDNGIYTVQLKKDSRFKGEVLYNGQILYSIDYVVDSNWFLGGNGTKDDPYIITASGHLNLINLIEDGYNKYYKLYKDIYIQDDFQFSPIGTKLNPFNGSIDGNGCTIKNLNVNDFKIGGFIGYLGEKGEILNLKFDNVKISVSSNNNDTLYAGVVAGVNYGKIENCIITNDTNITIKRDNQIPNYIIYSYAGGVVGANYGKINNAFVDNSEIKNETKHQYQANSDVKNQQYVYAGGIAGTSISGSILNSYSGKGLKLFINAESICSDALSTRHPYVKTYSGGIIGFASNTTISNVYSDVIDSNNIVNLTVKNIDPWGNSDKHNCNSSIHTYVASYEKEDNDKIIANLKENSFKDFLLEINKSNNISYSFDSDDTEKDNEFVDYFVEQVYEFGEEKFKNSNLNILLNGIEVEYYIVDIYGFSPYFVNYKEENGKRVYLDSYNDVTVIVKLIETNCIQKVIIPIVTKKVTPISLEVTMKPNKTEYNLSNSDIDVSTNGLIVSLKYQDGFLEDVTNNVIVDEKVNLNSNVTEVQQIIIDENGIITTPAKTNVNIKYIFDNLQSFKTSYEVSLFCQHYWINEEIDNHCEHLGYSLHNCIICGLQYRDNFTDGRLSHDTVIFSANDSQTKGIDGYQGYYDSTCKSLGYSGDIYCLRCKSVVGKGTIIELKEHVYCKESGDSLAHYCINCGNPENHYFYTKEIDTHVHANCQYCGYEKEYSANSLEKIKELPRIIISDTYVLPKSNEVIVYVELHGNIGITSAYFSVLFPEKLKLKKYYLGNILNKADVAEFKQYSDHLNVQLASKDAELSKKGTLLKLVFALPKDSKIDYEYRIYISGQKLTDENEKNIEFITLDGNILVVDRLPGDVNGDGIVDLLDASLIAKYNVSDNKNDFILDWLEIYEDFDISFGDVSLDGLRDGTDIVKILRYIVGGYNTKIWANRFKVTLDFNNDLLQNEFIYVEYNNGNGTYGDLLPEVILDGYKFEGWYIDREYTVKLSGESKIKINNDQLKQTLYAKYLLNTVIVDGNGGTTDSVVNEFFYTDYENSQIIDGKYLELGNNGYLKTTETKFLYDGYMDKCDIVKCNHVFLGWATSIDGTINSDLLDYVKLNDNNLIYAIDLKTSGYYGIGNLQLYAIWSKEEIEPRDIQNFAYTFVKWESISGKTWSNIENLLVENSETYIAKWQSKPITIYFRGNNADNFNTYKQENYIIGKNLDLNNFKRQGYVFLGWSLSQEEANDKNASIIKDGGVLPNTAYNSGGEVILYAVWSKYKYRVIYNANVPDYAISFKTSQKEYQIKYYTSLESQNLIMTDYEYERDKSYCIKVDTYTLLGWNLVGWEDKRTGNIYDINGSFTNLVSCDSPNQSVVLYAVWELNPYEVGQNVNSGTKVSNSDGTNSYVVYKGLDNTPWAINYNVIFDWRNETNLDFNNSNRDIPVDQSFRKGNLDIYNKTDEVYFIGKHDKVFENFEINLVDFTDSQQVITINFVDFSFNTNMSYSIVQWRSDEKHSESGPDLHIAFKGICNLGTNYLGGHIFGEIDRPINSLTFEGDGEVTIRGGQGASGENSGNNGHDGGVAIYAINMIINADEKSNIKIYGGNGGTGSSGISGNNGSNCDKNDGGNGCDGTNGGNGGAGASAISAKVTTIISEIYLQSGDSGDGGNGGNGGNAGSWTNVWSCGARPGKGGNGGNGGNAGIIYAPLVSEQCTGLDKCKIEYGSYGKGGNAGNGGAAGNHTGWFGHSCWGSNGENGVNGLSYLSTYSDSNSTYKLFSAKFTWDEAKEWSEKSGGHLVTITSEEENSIIKSLLEEANLSSAWIGLNDIQSEGVWRWVTGENYSYSNWNDGEPNNINNEDCVELLKEGLWNDNSQLYRGFGFVVEFQ